MKKFIFIFVFVTTGLYSQNPKIIDSSAVYTNTYIGEVDTRDSDCFKNIELAKKDFANNIITYYDYRGYGNRLRNREIFKKEIEKLNIKYKLELLSCMHPTLITKNFIPRENCYEDCMQNLVLEKFGETFFSNLDDKCDSIYVLQNLDKIFDSSECDDFLVRYKKSLGKEYSKQFDDIKEELNTIIKYPKDYKYKNEEYFSHTECNFIIHKDGTISNIELETVFQNKYNERFTKYFENKIKDFVLKSQWFPATSQGIVVDSLWHVLFFYK